MNLAFYYHIPLYISSNGDLYLPGYLGVFIDALAKELEQLTLLAHTTKENTNADYLLKSKNILVVDLGGKTPAWHRMLFHKRILKDKFKQIVNCDILLVRSPSPLAPYFHKYLNSQRLVFLIVGDYHSGAIEMKVNKFRDRIIQLFLIYNDHLLKEQIKKTDIVVNSPELVEKYNGIAKRIGLIKTTTLSESDFFEREDTCLGKVINILYTGRLDLAKGLMELLEAFSLLKIEYPHIRLHYVGWEDNSQKPVEKVLQNRAKELNIDDSVIFHGKKKVGNELNAIYRMADIYVIPSYHEGFPRTIWEAMANGLPVVATNVGSIPHYLINKQEALLIEPKSVNQLKDAIITIIENAKMRRNIIAAGKNLVTENTLEKQTLILIDILKQKI